MSCDVTCVKFLTFPTSNNFTVNSKIQTKRFYHGVILLKDVNGIANSKDPDQTAPLACLSKTLESLK